MEATEYRIVGERLTEGGDRWVPFVERSAVLRRSPNHRGVRVEGRVTTPWEDVDVPAPISDLGVP